MHECSSVRSDFMIQLYGWKVKYVAFQVLHTNNAGADHAPSVCCLSLMSSPVLKHQHLRVRCQFFKLMISGSNQAYGYNHTKCLYLSHIKALSDQYQNPKLMNVLQVGSVFVVLLFEASFPYMILMILVRRATYICTLDPSLYSKSITASHRYWNPYQDIHPKCLECSVPPSTFKHPHQFVNAARC